jgi:drug/metabolite transporter (DMT)-like permease
LGAVHWGLAISLSSQDQATYLAGLDQAEFETRSFIWGVTPSLLAWLAGAFSPPQFTLWILALILVLVWLVDQRFLKPMKAFDAYLRLRNHLTLGAILGLLVTACFV